MELIVGSQLDGLVPRSVSVYAYTQGQLQQVLTTNYTELLLCDLDVDNCSELMVIGSGAGQPDRGAVTLYSMASGSMTRSNEAAMSGPVDNLKRIITGNLHGGIPAVFVGSTVEESAIITDIYALLDGVLTNVSLSGESGTSVQTLRNFYVYADDIDDDGEVEMPALITMKPVRQTEMAAEQHLIRWYAIGASGATKDKMFTYHNYMGGWYMQLDPTWIDRISVVQEGSAYCFYLWDEEGRQTELIFSVCVLTGQNREEQAQMDNRFVLHKTESVIYAARMEVASGALQITQEDLINSFRLIHLDWNTGEM